MKQHNKLEGYGPIGALINALSSIWLACVLIGCMMVLTYFGTYAQVDMGLHEAINTYFKSFFLVADMARLAETPVIGIAFGALDAIGISGLPYFPGGMTCMGLLSINMFLGGFLRMRITKRNFGVVIIHIGIAFMLIAGLVKTTTAVEGKISLIEGQTTNFFDSYTAWEVAVWDLDKPMTGDELVILDGHLRDLEGDASRTFTHPGLPFELVLSNFVANCRAEEKGPNWEATGPVVNGWGLYGLPRDKEAEFNTAGMHATVKTPQGDATAILWGRQFAPWTVEFEGRRFAIDMRHERYPMPFAIRLDDFIKDDHPGMSMARAYQSHVTRIDGDGEQPVLIQMNEPLRDGDLVLFQSSFNQAGGRELSVFSVVRNVSDKWPEYALWVTTFGMLWVFGYKLFQFVMRQAKRNAMPSGGV